MARRVPRRIVSVPVTYEINPQHRNATHNKSQWTISERDELLVFELARKRNWLIASHGWGLHVSTDHAEYCGVAQDHKTQVFLAKFVDDTRQNVWHGYPTLNDHGGNRPPDVILADWMELRLVRPAIVRKLDRGQPCGL